MIATQQSFFQKLALGNGVQMAGEEWEEDRAQQSASTQPLQFNTSRNVSHVCATPPIGSVLQPTPINYKNIVVKVVRPKPYRPYRPHRLWCNHSVVKTTNLLIYTCLGSTQPLFPYPPTTREQAWLLSYIGIVLAIRDSKYILRSYCVEIILMCTNTHTLHIVWCDLHPQHNP